MPKISKKWKYKAIFQWQISESTKTTQSQTICPKHAPSSTVIYKKLFSSLTNHKKIKRHGKSTIVKVKSEEKCKKSIKWMKIVKKLSKFSPNNLHLKKWKEKILLEGKKEVEIKKVLKLWIFLNWRWIKVIRLKFCIHKSAYNIFRYYIWWVHKITHLFKFFLLKGNGNENLFHYTWDIKA